jgi:hypothetical protein
MLHTSPAVLKAEINAQFRERFPLIQLTLTKLRSLKRDIVDIACNQLHLDVAVAAYAHAFFERVVLRGVLKKSTRKVFAAVCLMLSLKFNYDAAATAVLPDMWDCISETWALSRPQVPALHALTIYSPPIFYMPIRFSFSHLFFSHTSPLLLYLLHEEIFLKKTMFI